LDDLELLSVRIFERIALDFADFGGNNSYRIYSRISRKIYDKILTS